MQQAYIMAGLEGYRPRPKEAAFHAGSQRRANPLGGDTVQARIETDFYRQDTPHEQLVAAIREFLAQDQERQIVPDPVLEEDKKLSLNPLWRLRQHLCIAALNSPPGIIINGSREPSQQQKFYRDLGKAWDAISYIHYPEGSRDKKDVHGGMELGLFMSGQTSDPYVVLTDQSQVALLDAMAEAVGIPHERGQSEIPLPPGLRYEPHRRW